MAGYFQASRRIAPPNSNRVRIVVATSVMLTFISFWRAAAIVLNDLGSSAFYAAGIAEQAVGQSRTVVHPRGHALLFHRSRGVRRELLDVRARRRLPRGQRSLGGRLAKISVSALMFDYILTGPISGVSAGHYIGGLINDVLVDRRHAWLGPAAVHTMFSGTPQINENWLRSYSPWL